MGVITKDTNTAQHTEASSVKKEDKFTGSYFQWLKQELTGWDRFPWGLLFFGVGFELSTTIAAPITWQSIVAFIGIFFGMFCVVAMSAGGYDTDGNRVVSHAINGYFGAVSVIAYIIVNINAQHYFSVIDQLFFFFLIDVELMFTWRTWGRGKNSEIRQLKVKQWVLAVAVILGLWLVLYHIGQIPALGEHNALWDSLALAIGSVASYLCFRRYTETYSLWLISDVVNIALWFSALQHGYSAQSLPMLIMTLFYFVSAIYGRIVWRKNGTNTEKATKKVDTLAKV